jgi:hypothetical protein
MSQKRRTFDEGNPYRTAVVPTTQEHSLGLRRWVLRTLALLSEVTTRAHRAAWDEKSFLSRRFTNLRCNGDEKCSERTQITV